MEDKKKVIYKFFNSQQLATISTVNSDGNPESALVGFGEKEDLSLIVGTYKGTRKYENFLRNPKVAIVIGLGIEKITVQYEGTARIMPESEIEGYKELYYAKNPTAVKYESYLKQVYLKIVPRWIRYTDYNKKPNEIFEVTF